MSENSLRNYDGKYCDTPYFYRPHQILKSIQFILSNFNRRLQFKMFK